MKYHKDVLKNGLRIITVPMKESQSAIAMVLVEAGSRYETKDNNGISHFLEHMCFKGTKERTGAEINNQLDSLGASSNAFTGEEYTGYYAKAHSRKIGKILDIVSDIYLNSVFSEKDIEIEKGVILEEINMYEDIPMAKVGDIWDELLYDDQPAGRTILGPKKNIQKMKRNDFVKYHKDHYVPQKTVVVVAGNIDKKEVIKQVKEKFGALPKSKIIKKTKTKESQKSPAVKIFNKKSDQTHLVIGFRSFGLNDKRNTHLRVASTILGSGMSSRLFKKMRDELGMCYYVRSSNFVYTDTGVFIVSAGVGNSRIKEAISVVVSEFKKLRDEEISEKEIKKAKEYLMGNLATSHETSDAWADFYGIQELRHEKIKTLKEIEKKIKAVTYQDINKALKEVFKNSGLNLAIVGPHNKPVEFKKLLKV